MMWVNPQFVFARSCSGSKADASKKAASGRKVEQAHSDPGSGSGSWVPNSRHGTIKEDFGRARHCRASGASASKVASEKPSDKLHWVFQFHQLVELFTESGQAVGNQPLHPSLERLLVLHMLQGLKLLSCTGRFEEAYHLLDKVLTLNAQDSAHLHALIHGQDRTLELRSRIDDKHT